MDKDTKIALISSTAMKVEPENYGGLEEIVYLLGRELVDKDYDVTLIAPQTSEIEGAKVIETVKPRQTIDAFAYEEKAFQMYKNHLPNFDIICDHSWQKFSYLVKARNPEKMEGTKVCSVMHGMAQDMSPPPVENPNFITVSKTAAQEWSEKVGVPFRHAYNSVPVEPYNLKEDKDDHYMTLNRIMPEKGIHEFVGLMKRLRRKAKVVGEDRFVDDQSYVSQIQSMCDQMMIEYLGRVSTQKKVGLLQNAKALILTPLKPYSEVFGMAAVEANLTGTPVIALRNCGLTEVIEDGENGYLANSVDEIGEIIKSGKAEELDPKECRNYAMRRFTPKRMTNRYLTLFGDISEGREW